MYIYLITNSINKKQYVGCTSRTPDVRWNEHVYDSKNDPRTAIHNAISKYGQECFSLEIVDECYTLDEMVELEKKWIKQIDSYNTGYNCTTGGNYTILSEEARAKIGKVHKGRKQTKEHIRKCVDARKKLNLQPMLGKNHTEETKEKMRNNQSRNKVVLQMDSDDNIVNEYMSVREASRQTNISRTTINKVCKGIGSFAGGFKWRHK